MIQGLTTAQTFWELLIASYKKSNHEVLIRACHELYHVELSFHSLTDLSQQEHRKYLQDHLA